MGGLIAIELNLMIQAYQLVMLKICSVLLIRRLTISRFAGYLVIILKKDFVVSNRKGTRGEHDIWYVTEWTKQFIVSGTVVSTKNGKPIKDVTIEVSDKLGGSFTVTTDANGKFNIPKGQLLENMSYKLNMSREKNF